ncbi:MAG: ABC transporter substrate-binding protein [Candidatus Promineifilaceae bacterium]
MIAQARRGIPIVVVSAVMVTTLVAACGTTANETPENEQAAEMGAAGEEEDDGPTRALIEVTRIVVETSIVPVTPRGPRPSPQPKKLAICIPAEPDSLYYYGAPSAGLAATHVLHGLYESLYTSLSYSYQARGLEKLPSLADGDARIRQVEVAPGDVVLDATGSVVSLAEGVTVRSAAGDLVAFSGAPLRMSQMVVRFSLKPLVWSDGVGVTAADSVFSFKLAAAAETPVAKTAVERTASYQALGKLELEWVGVPGYLDEEYFTRVWMPLPEHVWGEMAPAELLRSAEARRRPLGHGPFVVSEWLPGEYLRLERNQHYYRAAEGLPRLDEVTFRFEPDSGQAIARLLSGECDIVTHEGIRSADIPLLVEAEQSGLLAPHFQGGTVFEHIDFGINPATGYAASRPDWFEDVRVRQAFIMCLDRQRMLDELLYGKSELVHAYVPAGHPLFPEDASLWPLDRGRANALLDEAGYADSDADGIRNDPAVGLPFKVTLLSVLGSDFAERLAAMVRQDLAQCGIEVETKLIDSQTYFADGAEGPLFGRRFDLAAFPWLISSEPNCSLYLASRVPGPENNWNRGFNNETGFANTEFDAACMQALTSLPGQDAYSQGHRQALRVFTQQVPIIPLFLRLKAAATRPGVANFRLDPSQPSELWNLYALE